MPAAPGGLPSNYYQGTMLPICSDQMATGVSSMAQLQSKDDPDHSCCRTPSKLKRTVGYLKHLVATTFHYKPLSFMKWNERNFVGFEASLPPMLIKSKKNIFVGGPGEFKMCVCPFVCLSVSVCDCNIVIQLLAPTMVRSWLNFQGQPNSLHIIFGQAFWALGLRLNPQMGPFLPNLSPPRILGQRGCVIPFWKLEDEAKKCRERNFDFSPTFWDNGAGRRGWPGESQNFGISYPY